MKGGRSKANGATTKATMRKNHVELKYPAPEEADILETDRGGLDPDIFICQTKTR
jgi:hypothetical protein